ncbi:fluoride efflux transporter CrcB [Bacillus songklensis]|uniref:Fluoride-specific ion channel FluC n=1 Tax=Bacillus songklensis TaxID=1069116 RepID=A0ABV8B367_9BACI
MSTILAVAFGGAIGAVLRYVIGEYLKGYKIKQLTIGTFIINLIGSFFLGWLMGLQMPVNAWYTFFLTTGICGAFTTFSTFVIESISYMKKRAMMTAVIYVIITMIICPIFFMLGYRV